MTKIFKLKEERNLKNREIKLNKRRPKTDPEMEYRELNLQFGSVWIIPDESIPFDRERNDEDIKDNGRPCIVLETPEEFNDYSLVDTAPGTSKQHTIFDNKFPCLLAHSPPEDLKKDTYFLLYFRWYAVQKTLDRKVGEISNDLEKILTKLLRKLDI